MTNLATALALIAVAVTYLTLQEGAAGVRYLIAIGLVSTSGDVPRRLGLFLDWAHAAG